MEYLQTSVNVKFKHFSAMINHVVFCNSNNCIEVKLTFLPNEEKYIVLKREMKGFSPVI